MWDDSTFVGFDFETTGELPEYALQPWRVRQGKAWPTSLVTVRHKTPGFEIGGGLFPTRQAMKDTLQRAVDENHTFVGWNTTFDIAWFLAHDLDDLVFRIKWLDGMLLWRHWFIEPEYDMNRNNKKSYGLKACVEEVWPDKAGYDEDVDFHSTDPAELDKLHRYNIRDSAFTLRLAKKWYKLLEQEPQRLKVALIEAAALPHVAKANLDGMLVDTLVTRELAGYLDKVAAERLEVLAPDGITEKVVRSPKQLSTLMFDVWGLPVLKENRSPKTGAVSRSTDKEVLHELAFIDQRAKLVRDYREALGNKTKFAEAPLVSADYNGDGRTRPQAIVFGTYSGRMTYASKQGRNKDERQTGFALHQEKNSRLYRSAITAPPGFTLMEFDAAGQEFRWMAIASGDPIMLGLCAPGEDAHSYMGSRIVGRDYLQLVEAVHSDDPRANADRKMGKVANLCVAGDTLVLTDRGVVPIVEVTHRDLVWDGVEFVQHGGVVFSGVRPVISHGGVTATPDHKVLVQGRWERLDEAARHGWEIEPALGSGWACKARSSVRIVDGLVRRAVSEVGRALRASPLRLWFGARLEPALSGDGSQRAMQGMCSASTPQAGWPCGGHGRASAPGAEACERLVSALPQPGFQSLPQLRGTWDRVQIFFGRRGRSLRAGAFATPYVSEAGHRPGGQRWPLRAGQPASGDTQAEPSQQTLEPVYDIVNCGPRTRFAANGVIVHNSLQYRTSAPKLRVVARVQYNIPMELPQAEVIHKTYQRTYQQVPVYWKQQIAQTKRDGYVETLAGRRVQVVGNWQGAKGWSMGSTAVNYRIQGTGADQKYLAMKVVAPYLRKIGAYFAWDLHDGIYLYVPDDKVERAAVDIKYLLDNLPYRAAWGFTPPIPMPWDCKAGKSWGTLKEYHYE